MLCWRTTSKLMRLPRKRTSQRYGKLFASHVLEPRNSRLLHFVVCKSLFIQIIWKILFNISKSLDTMKNLLLFLNKEWDIQMPITVFILTWVLCMQNTNHTDWWITSQLIIKRLSSQDWLDHVKCSKCGLRLFCCTKIMINGIKLSSQWLSILQHHSDMIFSPETSSRLQTMTSTTDQWSSILKKSQCNWMISWSLLETKLIWQKLWALWRELDILVWLNHSSRVSKATILLLSTKPLTRSILKSKIMPVWDNQSRTMIALSQTHWLQNLRITSFLTAEESHLYSIERTRSSRRVSMFLRKINFSKTQWRLSLKAKTQHLLKTWWDQSWKWKTRSFLLLCFTHATNWSSLMLLLKLHGEVTWWSSLCHTSSNSSKTYLPELRLSKRALKISRRREKRRRRKDLTNHWLWMLRWCSHKWVHHLCQHSCQLQVWCNNQTQWWTKTQWVVWTWVVAWANNKTHSVNNSERKLWAFMIFSDCWYIIILTSPWNCIWLL